MKKKRLRLKRELTLNALIYFKRVLLRHIDSLVIVFLLILLLGYSLTRFNLTEWFSVLVMLEVLVMFLGQILLIFQHGFSYPFYSSSFTATIWVSALIWFASHMLLSESTDILIFFVVAGTLIALPLIIHLLTKKRTATIQMIPIFSVFFFGLLIALSNPKTLPSESYDSLFFLTIVLFTLTSIFGLNIAYRTMMLRKELKISNRNQYLRKTKDDLLKKHTDKKAQADIDLLTYYLISSLDSFVYGDFERSYMDAFKIIENRGTAFKTIYTLSMDEEKWKHLEDIRNNLSHARIREDKKDKTEDKEDLQKLRELKKGLFQETLDILKIVRFQFIDIALKNSNS